LNVYVTRKGLNMTDNEIALLIECLRWRMGYENSNPEVGFGPFLDDLLDGICRSVGMNLSMELKEDIIALYKLRYRDY
jgi:hypothetical protein